MKNPERQSKQSPKIREAIQNLLHREKIAPEAATPEPAIPPARPLSTCDPGIDAAVEAWRNPRPLVSESNDQEV